MAENEKKFIKAYAHPRMNYARSLTKPESPDNMLDLLDRYLQLAPAMVPPQSHDDICTRQRFGIRTSILTMSSSTRIEANYPGNRLASGCSSTTLLPVWRPNNV